jgi:hypothetical protein
MNLVRTTGDLAYGAHRCMHHNDVTVSEAKGLQIVGELRTAVHDSDHALG